MRQLNPRWPVASDVAIAVLVLAAGQANVWIGLDSYDVGHVPRGVDAALAAAMSAPLVIRRRSPYLSFLLVAAAFFVPDLVVRTGVLVWGEWLPFLIAAYSVAAHAARRSTVVVSGVALAGIVVLTLRHEEFQQVGAWAFWFFVVGAAYTAGRATRTLRMRAQRLAAQADELERHQEARAREAIATERTRIARELHDVIAHNVSVMVIQAGAAEQVMDRDAAASREALAHVQEAGREALEEMQLLLGVLRDDAATEPLAPTPNLRGLERLVAQMRHAGQEVELSIEGQSRALSGAVESSVYRIVQEALTNALRHAPGAAVQVLVRFDPRRLLIDVMDQGTGTRTPGAAGRGLIGMRERAAMHGGQFSAGATPGAGFHVRVELPLEDART